jgi:hypothetical protein
MANGRKSSWRLSPAGGVRSPDGPELHPTGAAARPGTSECHRVRGVEVAVFAAEALEQIGPTMDKAKAWGVHLTSYRRPLFSFNRRFVIERAAASARDLCGPKWRKRVV